MSRIPQAEVDKVYERAAGYCEACGLPMLSRRGDAELHHRQARQMGGSHRALDVAENLVALHPACHRLVHAKPQLAKEYGLIVEASEDYRAKPFRPWLTAPYPARRRSQLPRLRSSVRPIGSPRKGSGGGSLNSPPPGRSLTPE